jgi:hypothetical protein
VNRRAPHRKVEHLEIAEWVERTGTMPGMPDEAATTGDQVITD